MLQYGSSGNVAPPHWLGVRQPARRYASSAGPPSGSPAGSPAGSPSVSPPRPPSGPRRRSKTSSKADPAIRASRLRRRLLADAAARVENTPEYLSSLAALQRLVTGFRQELNEAQNSRWLAVEDALLEHAARVNEAYFWEGAAIGGRGSLRAGRGHENAAIASLARLILWLATR